MLHMQVHICRPIYFLATLLLLLSLSFLGGLTVLVARFVCAYHRQPCTRSVRKQFQFSDCYVPNMEQDSLLLFQASFVLSHDAATGYLPERSVSSVANSYAKNQIGTVYQQLNDGARALDVRPKLLANGTVVCHHGVIVIPITLQQLVHDALRWCHDNPQELVLILHHDLAYPTSVSTSAANDNSDGATGTTTTSITPSLEVAVAALSQVYQSLGVTYVQCSELFGLTVGETMALAALDGGGYLLAMDQHDAYASSCAKQNYVEDMLVTCYSNRSTADRSSSSSSSSAPCFNSHSYHLQALKDYVTASANNDPTDNNQQLGPPKSIYQYPFNEIQALWQVDATSAALGLAHVSTLIDDNTKSHLNAHVVDWVYEGSFESISLLAIDHVQLNGNALLSVLRNQCGQSVLSFDSNNENNENLYQEIDNTTLLCGMSLPKPKMQSKPLSTLSFFVMLTVFAAFGIWVAILLAHYRRYYQNNRAQLQALDRDILEAAQQFGCGRNERQEENSFVLM